MSMLMQATSGAQVRCGTATWACLMLLLTIAFAPPVSADLSPGLHENLSIEFDGIDRLYDVYVSSGYTGNVAVPLLVDLHGFGAAAIDQRAISGFDRLADSQGFLVAYPNGRGGSWNDGILVNTNFDDVGFMQAMVTAIDDEANLDLARIYATGWSSGGDMVHRLACDATDFFAAFASFAGEILADWTLDDCAASRPFSIIMFRGLSDQSVPYDGGIVFGQNIAGAHATFAFWRRRNECGSAAADQSIRPGNTTECEIDTSCADGVRVEFCTVQSNASNGHNLYRNADSLNLASLAWDFMSEFQLPESAGNFSINFGLTGGWFTPETAGQGLVIEVLPNSQQVFVTWFTYLTQDSAAEKVGSSDHRWLSGLGEIDGNRVEVDLRVTSGGFFDDPVDVERTPTGTYGSLILEFEDCANATMSYDLIEEELTGSRPLVRLSAPPQACLDLAASL